MHDLPLPSESAGSPDDTGTRTTWDAGPSDHQTDAPRDRAAASPGQADASPGQADASPGQADASPDQADASPDQEAMPGPSSNDGRAGGGTPVPGRSSQPGPHLPRGTSIIVTAALAAVLASASTLTLAGLTAHPAATVTTAGGTTTGAVAAAATSTALTDVVATARSSVVTVDVQDTVVAGRWGGQIQASGTGSGVIVTSDGYILTAQHVVEGATAVSVTLADGKTYDARVIGVSSTDDVALIKIDASGLTAAPIASSSDLAVGEVVLAIGDPLGQYAGSVTLGIVSGTDRTIQVADTSIRTEVTRSGLIQTDAALNEGNSGGPLLDARGRVVGIVTATASSAEGLGFATPVSAAAPLFSQAGVTVSGSPTT